MSDKVSLTGEQIVMGNRTEQLQLYEIFYYPPETVGNQKRVDKIAVYFFLKDKDNNKAYAPRSIYFAELPQYRHFIINNILAYFDWLDNRIDPIIPKSQYRTLMLANLLSEIKEKAIERWRSLDGYGNITGRTKPLLFH